MNEIIERAFHGDATIAELAQLAVWRACAPECEREYQAVIRLLRAARALGEADVTRSVAAPSDIVVII